ncbi:MAG: SusC/RagA family protein, partial [Prevotella sp.]|nr:SusC/RagA family protein [Prevotella sp.]
YEFSVNWAHKVNNDLHFELRFNWTYTKNKYVYVDEPDYPYVWQVQTGRPLYSCVGYIAEGLFQSEEEIKMHADQTGLGSTPMVGDIKYRDINGDGKITTEDQAIVSPYGSLPRIQYGIGLSLNYKKFDFGVFFNGSDKTKRFIQGMQPFHANMGNAKGVMQWIADSYWSESNPNPNAEFPRLGLTNADDAQNTPNSTYWLRNFRYIRWKTLEVGYSFKFCRVYFSGDNLAVWSPFKYWDPEIWWNSYPLQRTFNFGVQVKI